ncbi:MAG: hypothetical protein B7Y91_00635 [Rhodobacterales bacterium 32-64-14]|nr:MAG: hypothetical protein B7Y91_00635 [Rhodobacterales bacterium 32-64-14]
MINLGMRLGTIFKTNLHGDVRPGKRVDDGALLPSVRESVRFHHLDCESLGIVVLAGRSLGWIARILGAHDVQSYSVENLLGFTSSGTGDGQKITHLIVDLDQMGGIHNAVDDLRRIREQWPEIVVVLISSDFAADDYSCDRLAVCDVSLRRPVGMASLEFGLMEASEVNNPVWQARCAQRRLNMPAGSQMVSPAREVG